MFFEASGDTYGDVARLLARHRAAGPGIRRARVVASRARAAFSGSRRGDGNTGVSGVSLTGRSCFLVRGSLAAPRTDRRRSGPPMLKMKTTRFGYTRVGRLYWDPVVGPGWPLSPPSEEPRPGLLAFIHPSVWKGDSATFARRGF